MALSQSWCGEWHMPNLPTFRWCAKIKRGVCSYVHTPSNNAIIYDYLLVTHSIISLWIWWFSWALLSCETLQAPLLFKYQSLRFQFPFRCPPLLPFQFPRYHNSLLIFYIFCSSKWEEKVILHITHTYTSLNKPQVSRYTCGSKILNDLDCIMLCIPQLPGGNIQLSLLSESQGCRVMPLAYKWNLLSPSCFIHLCCLTRYGLLGCGYHCSNTWKQMLTVMTRLDQLHTLMWTLPRDCMQIIYLGVGQILQI